MRLLASAVTAVLVALPGAAAHADDPVQVPPTGTISVAGDGSGHGAGLSQYGAYGAARDGLSAGQILDFYYPGTTRGEVGGAVRVLLTADDDRDLVVEQRSGLRVTALSSGRSWPLRAPGATRWRLTLADGVTTVSYRSARWRPLRTFRGAGEIAAGGAPLALRTPDGTVRYRGALRSLRDDGERVTVNVVPLEAYVRGVVPAEVSGIWPQQAMRAQAVASRTYAVFERRAWRARAYDLCDTAACQAYGGASAETTKSDRAVAGTARKVLVHQGEVAFAQFSASNGGWTTDGGRPYLPAQEDPYEGSSPDYYGWTVQVKVSAIEQAYNIDNLTGLQIETRDGHGPRGGRVEVVRLWNDDSGWTGTVTGDSFRRNFGLRSTLFEVTGTS